MGASTLDAPPLRGLADAIAEADRCFDRIRAVRAGLHVNQEGGDPSHHGHGGLLVRHLVHYLAAVELAERLDVRGPVVDVGSGVGAFAAWAAGRLGAGLHLVDHSPSVRAVAQRAFPHAHVHASATEAPPGALVTAMEVLEHLPYDQQPGFLQSLARLLAPGGILVLSTPDETGYPGGWSGYAPHIGPVDFAGLRSLLARATEQPAIVWRLEGPGYELSRVQRWVQPVVNRAWGTFSARAPGISDRVASALASLPRRPPSVSEGQIRCTTDPAGTGTGLLAAVHRRP